LTWRANAVTILYRLRRRRRIGAANRRRNVAGETVSENSEFHVDPPAQSVSQTVEDYIKVIYKLQQTAERVSTNDIARAMGTSAAAATKMCKYLAERNLASREAYYGVRLTPVGEKIALETIRHHRLIELYLVQALGYGWDEVDAEAERLEHHISEEFEERIDRLLGRPQVDPHGDPIPSRDGVVAPTQGRPLDQAQPGEKLVVLRVSDSSPEALRHLAQLGVDLGARIEVLVVPTSGTPLTATINGATRELDSGLAARVFVEGDAAG
jgi:DtxR family Mn-dependent transcriptional regulator